MDHEEFGNESRAVEPKCGNCGADVAWDPVADALSCAHCGHEQQVPRGEGDIEEHPLEEAGTAARGLGLEVRAARCRTCGAQVAFGKAAVSKACVFCGSPHVLEAEANRNAIRPESLIPLDVGRDRVKTAFRRWIAARFWAPGALKKTKRFDATGVYLPAWTFDCRVHSDWSADAGHYYYVTETYTTMVNGKPQTRTRRVRKTRWVPAWGQRDDAFDDHQVVASHGVSEAMVEKLGRFDTGALVPYKPEYLAGWHAEEYRIDLEQGWAKGKAMIRAIQRRRCSGDVPGDTQRSLRVQNTFRDVSWKHVLLPMWTVTYTFRDKRYAVLVHGQNGTIVGDAPISVAKIVVAVLAGLAVIGGIVAIVLVSSS